MNRKSLLIFLYLYALIFSVSKAIRMPNQWAQSHWLLDYRFGFIKRGLAGEIFGFLSAKNTFSITVLSIGIIAVLYFLIVKIALKVTWNNEKSYSGILFFVIFLLSQYIVFSAHLIGYLDHVIFLLAILAVYLIIRKKLFLSSLIAVFSVFIHEISVILMLPACCLAIIVNDTSIRNFSFKNIFAKTTLTNLAIFLVLPVFAAVSISFFQEINGENYYSQIFNYLRQSSIPENVSGSVSSAYTKSFTYYFKDQHEHFIQRLFISKATIFYGIPLLFLLWVIFKEFKLKQNIQLLILLILISFIPLLLHSIAYDTYRIWSFPFMILFLIFWILSSGFKGDNQTEIVSRREIVFFMISFLLVSLIPNILFDGETERFSLPVKFVLMLPILAILYFLKKLQSKN
ncbi:hypothetical protein QF023_001415 [Chryseobacterium sp. SLBN-27]|uniref:hypothetical protein n=1 Tax=Chryseobacterium sp. SLBN-27 TaxID=3042287 RepID=UPI00285BDE48|nr:hypothetical protein [Chryseobacterium sp. SLBN-27]MDR6157899.1 hypothetical protein [Chryseobacterium sp. SLBN-27]